MKPIRERRARVEVCRTPEGRWIVKAVDKAGDVVATSSKERGTLSGAFKDAQMFNAADCVLRVREHTWNIPDFVLPLEEVDKRWLVRRIHETRNHNKR